MGLPRSNHGKARFSAYVEGLTSVIGHADRAKPLRDYCLGLIMPGERKWGISKGGDGAASTITATLCIAAYGFLISERATIPPSRTRRTTLFPQIAPREGCQRRGAAVAA